MRKLLLVLATALVAGCGSGSREQLVSSNKDFVRCLSAFPTEIAHGSPDDADYIAKGASNYVAVTTTDNNTVNISVWRTVGDAQDAEAAYDALKGHGGLLVRQANAVFMWDSTPSSAQKTDIENCVLH